MTLPEKFSSADELSPHKSFDEANSHSSSLPTNFDEHQNGSEHTIAIETATLNQTVGGASRWSKTNGDDTRACETDEAARETNIETVKENATDGGWSWFIVIGCLLLRMVVGGLGRCHGILYNKFRERFNNSATSTALITSLTIFVKVSAGPLVSILTSRFSCRSLTAVGTFLLCLGLVLSAFTPNQSFLYFSFGVVVGLGRAFALTPAPILLGYYFEKRRSLAFGLASTGFSLGGFALSPVIEVLFESYGFQGAFVVLGGIGTTVFISAALFRPVELHRRITARGRKKLYKNTDEYSRVATDSDGPTEDQQTAGSHVKTADNGANENEELLEMNSSRENSDNQTKRKKTLLCCGGKQPSSEASKDDKKRKWISFSILKDVRFASYVLATVLLTLPSTLLFLPAIAKTRGVSDIKIAYLLSAYAATDTICRVVCGLLLDLKIFRSFRPHIFCGVLFVESLVEVFIPMMTNFEGFMAVSVLLGGLRGFRGAQGSVILMDIIGVDKFASSMAITMAVQSISVFIGPLISGQIKDIYGTYDGAFYFFAAAIFAGACIMAFGLIRKHCTDKKRAKETSDGLTEEEHSNT